ncbi:biopolymer transporter Tol [Pedobacter psychrophilus]|uniref:Biopolymer transporter Tol n=1 Tax=Pedobacter psychrophilus TaxID=1826909 RepID=A0A179DH53_9SPHI|nr:biopolymer transporter Tol [Pedobacter psychrophilus]OAQ40288.1 biopolymer transporter Tol [Pedobacter psychrophilus]
MRNSKQLKNRYYNFYSNRNTSLFILILMFTSCIISCKVKKTTAVVVPEWSLPGSSTHKQVPPPIDFHRVTKTSNKNIGIFDGQSDIGAALVPGSSSFDPISKEYTINSAGYNIWYTRDEFRFLWKKMSGDISLAADVKFPVAEGYSDRKAVVIIRQSLDDDAEEVMVGRHGAGLMHMAWRPEKNTMIQQMKVPEKGAMRIGIEKKGDNYAMFISLNGEPMHQLGNPVKISITEPFYVGIGFTSHIPDKSDTAILSNVVLENVAGKVR